MIGCAKECMKHKIPCQISECRLHIEYEEDQNCTLIAVKKNNVLTLEEIGKRLKRSAVRIKQIQDGALRKMAKR
jgi:DNA-directed RNA polymerase specialized sigma subunit